jgi:CPA2 family monovalent cation:H+ antiporter-2
LLASPSETTLIVLTAALGGHLINPAAAQFWQIVTAIGLTVTPILAIIGRWLGRRVDRQAIHQAPPPTDGSRALIVGFGRVGRLIADMLREHDKPFLAIDSDTDLIGQGLRDGYPVAYADGARTATLSRFGIATATAVILTMDDPHGVLRIVKRLRAEFPELPIIARARSASHAAQLYKAGANYAVPDALEGSLQLSEAALVNLGVPMGFVIASIHEKRDQFRQSIMEQGDLAEKPKLKTSRLRDHSAGR